MPIYSYKCKKCEKEFLSNHKASEEKEKCIEVNPDCVDAGGELTREWNSPNVHKAKDGEEDSELTEEELEKLKKKRQQQIDERMEDVDQDQLERRIKDHIEEVKYEKDKDKADDRMDINVGKILREKKDDGDNN